MKLLVVEDEHKTADYVRQGLTEAGFVVDLARDGPDGLHLATTEHYDLIVLDVMLPGMSGYDICRNVRARDEATPIVFLTAKDGEYDEADALDIGGDDFISKPFSPVVLAARLRALLRRAGEGPEPSVGVGSLRLEPAKQRAWLGTDELRLTAREMALVRYLVHRADHVVSKTEILDHVWDQAFEGDANVVEVYIGRLRRKLAPSPDVVIETVRGLGYRLSGRRT